MKFDDRSFMLNCELYASAVVVEDTQEASQVDKGSCSFVIRDGCDMFCRRLTSIKVLDLALAKATFDDDVQSVLL
jgi:hypothetical protein